MKTFIPRPSMHDQTMCSCLFGATVPFCKCVGWCASKKKFMTSHQVKQKGCLGKDCKCFYKIEDRGFWDARAKKKLRKKLYRIVTAY